MTQKRARAASWLEGSGIEIGGLHNPLHVAAGVEVRYVDRASEEGLRRQYPELSGEKIVPVSIVGDAQDLSAVASDSVDFVIANHLLEHLEDPIRGLEEMVRVLRRDGILYLALPDPRVKFDRDRPLTSVDHVVDEYRHGTSQSRERHVAEWVELAEPHVEWMRRAGIRSGPERVRELVELDYSIHFHVWRPDTFLEFLVVAKHETGIEIEMVAFAPCNPSTDDEYIFVFRKGFGATPAEVPLDLPDESLQLEIAGLRHELDQWRQAAEKAERDRREALQAMTSMLASPSWRITAPLRYARRALQRVERSRRPSKS